MSRITTYFSDPARIDRLERRARIATGVGLVMWLVYAAAFAQRIGAI